MDMKSLREQFRQTVTSLFAGQQDKIDAIMRADIYFDIANNSVTVSEKVNQAHPFVPIPRVVLERAAKDVYGAECTFAFGKALYTPELMERVFFPGGRKSEVWSKLAGFALAENWGADLSLLRNYVENTFEYLLIMEPSKVYEANGLLAFNTGLVDNAYDDIILCAKRSSDSYDIPYEYYGICTKNRSPEANGNQIRKDIRAAFGDELPRAQHLKNVSDAIYDIKLGKPEFNDLDHMILDNISRIPAQVTRDSLPGDAGLARSVADRDWGRVRGIVESSGALASLKRAFDDAVEYAFKQVCWNYKTAIPSFYPARKRIQLLLPLCFDAYRGEVGCALVVNKETEIFGGQPRVVYVAYTILDMSMAYKHARLITRPDSEWLTADAALK